MLYDLFRTGGLPTSNNGYIWKHPKKRDDIPLRVVAEREEQEKLLAAYHDSPWAGHRGTWATFEKIKREVLVAGTLPGHASVRNDLRKLPDALHSPTSGRASPNIPTGRPLQMDGRFGNDVDGCRTDAVFGAGSGGSNEPG